MVRLVDANSMLEFSIVNCQNRESGDRSDVPDVIIAKISAANNEFRWVKNDVPFLVAEVREIARWFDALSTDIKPVKRELILTGPVIGFSYKPVCEDLIKIAVHLNPEGMSEDLRKGGGRFLKFVMTGFQVRGIAASFSHELSECSKV